MAQTIPLEFEWSNFVARSGEVLVDPKTPNRTLDKIKFPNQDHGSTKSLVEGLLQRKGRPISSMVFILKRKANCYDRENYAIL